MFAVPSNDDTEIKSLKFGEFVRELGTSRYSINVTWTGPVFNFNLISYNIEYELTGYQSNRPTVQINVVWWLPLISIGFIVLIFLLIARVTEFFLTIWEISRLLNALYTLDERAFCLRNFKGQNFMILRQI